MNSVEYVTVPEFESAYEFPISENVEKVAKDTIKWADELGILKEYNNYEPSMNMLYYFPTMPLVSFEKELIFSKAILVVFLMDDICDASTLNQSFDRIYSIYQSSSRVFSGTYIEPDSGETNDPLEKAVVHLFTEGMKLTDTETLRRFRLALKYTYAAVKMELKIKRRRKEIYVNDYEVCSSIYRVVKDIF
ncbi:hypothetical protein B4U80_11719 [Leptotrombidium deliense]|uniref:Terpenoid synthase n=1 Tax=Leptotrombidium deliense TaxID=299467 RepID=A0A443S3C4_9ACAR|nr:hypothetical protein B4U80_11719 [Leptotrombidium deliense]